MMTVTQQPPSARVPLRLRLSDLSNPHALDGGWWPQSRNLEVEMSDLVDHFPVDRARILRARYSQPDWDDSPKRVTTARSYIDASAFRVDGTHVVVLTTSDRLELCLLVVPPHLSATQGEEALEAAVTPGFAVTPALLLAKISEGHDPED